MEQTERSWPAVAEALYLPAFRGKPAVWLTIAENGVRRYEFQIALPERGECPQFWAKIPLCGAVRMVGASDEFYDAVCTEPAAVSAEPERPALHFTTNSGWINDPNGLIFVDGVWHAYYQYNPLSTSWANMSWGHATSPDLLHWTKQEPVLYPDEYGPAFSGSAIHMPDGGQAFFYTAAGGLTPWSAGRQYTQQWAVSTDGGRTFQKRGTTLPAIEPENRDPKVFYHAESGAYIMVLWLTAHDFAILRSTDLTEWMLSQRLTLPGGYECPDLFRLTDPSGSDACWVFWSADGTWYAGEFDGFRFDWDGVVHHAYATRHAYAAQTFSGADRVISMPWIRFANNGRCFTGALGLPRTLGLSRRNGMRVITQQPVREWDEIRRDSVPVRGTAELPAVTWELTVQRRPDEKLTVQLGNWSLTWADDVLTADGESFSASGNDLRMIRDGFLLELFADSGAWYSPMDLTGVPNNAITVTGAQSAMLCAVE